MKYIGGIIIGLILVVAALVIAGEDNALYPTSEDYVHGDGVAAGDIDLNGNYLAFNKTLSAPELGYSGAVIITLNAAHTGYTPLRASTVYSGSGGNGFIAEGTGFIGFSGSTKLLAPADGKLTLSNAAATAGVVLDVTTDGTLQVYARDGSSDGNVAATGGIKGGSKTADPCGSLPVGSFFYNSTSGYPCYCDNAGVDLRMDGTTACF